MTLDVPAVRTRAETVLRKQARWREFGHSVPSTVEVHEVAQDVLLLADELEQAQIALRNIAQFCQKASEDLWPQIEYVHREAAEALVSSRVAPERGETP